MLPQTIPSVDFVVSAPPNMQRPTCSALRVRSPADAQVIFHAVFLGILPMVSRRLDTEERRAIAPGSVFVWEERGPNAEATGLGIERWTDGIRWGPSRVRDEFLFYHEKDPEPADMEMTSDSDTPFGVRTQSSSSRGYQREGLIKQTYSVFVETPRGRRKWHLIAYFTQESAEHLRSIDDIPQLAALSVPPGKYRSARSAKGRPRDAQQSFERFGSPMTMFPSYGSKSHYTPYPHPSPVESVSQPQHHSSAWCDPATPRPDDHVSVNRSKPRLMSQHNVEVLAPLSYLQKISPIPRHPMDEKALMSFSRALH